MISATALCNGAATIVNAIATGKGAAFGIGLETKVRVDLMESGDISVVMSGLEEDPKLVKLCVKKVLETLRFDYGATVTTESNIPIARGLKSSSVVANAAVLATFGALAKKHGRITGLRINKHETRQQLEINRSVVQPDLILKLGIEAAKEAGVTITGALDDAAAAFYGGFVVTDNTQNKILRKGDLESCDVLIFVPSEKSYTKDFDVAKAKLFAREIDLIWNEALKGDLYTAMTLNGLVYSATLEQSNEVAMAALKEGAIAAGLSGTGPAVVALTRSAPGRIVSAWHTFDGEVIKTKVSNQRAKVIE